VTAAERDPTFTPAGNCVPNHRHVMAGARLAEGAAADVELLRAIPGSSIVVAPADTDFADPTVAAHLEETFGGGGYTAAARGIVAARLGSRFSALDGLKAPSNCTQAADCRPGVAGCGAALMITTRWPRRAQRDQHADAGNRPEQYPAATLAPRGSTRQRRLRTLTAPRLAQPRAGRARRGDWQRARRRLIIQCRNLAIRDSTMADGTSRSRRRRKSKLMTPSGINHLVINVRDMEESARF
jgi:hypothetical protein